MIKVIKWVAEDIVEEYLAAGHKLAVSPKQPTKKQNNKKVR